MSTTEDKNELSHEEDEEIGAEDEYESSDGISDFFPCRYCEYQSTNIDELDEHIVTHDEAIFDDEFGFGVKVESEEIVKSEPFHIISSPVGNDDSHLSDDPSSLEPGVTNYKEEDLKIKYEPWPSSREVQTSQQPTDHQYQRASSAATPPYVHKVYPHMSGGDFPGCRPLNGGGQLKQSSTVRDDLGNGLLPDNVIRKQRLNLKKILDDEPRPFKCLTCGTDFKQEVTLSQHERIHSDSRPYRCTECGKRFRQQSHLTQHLRIHTNEKPFKCVHCERSFRQRAILNQHLRIHSGEKPYECPECGKKFRQKAILDQHVRTHGEEKCFRIVPVTFSISKAHHRKKL